YLTSIGSPENDKFLAAMDKRFGKDLKTPNELSEPQYEAFFLYKAAAEKAGSTDPAKVIRALDQVSFDGPRGPVSMDKSRHTPLAMRLGQIQADGSVKILQSFPDVDPGAQCPNIK
ncbi:MAG: transporter substrate-binding protein, partial [Paraburkholderia sp.]